MRLLTVFLLLSPLLALAKEPPKAAIDKVLARLGKNLEEDEGAKPSWKREAGPVETYEDYLGKQDGRTTTFYLVKYTATLKLPDGNRKVCPYTLSFYDKGGWREADPDTDGCQELGKPGEAAPEGDRLEALVKPYLDEYLAKKEKKPSDAKKFVVRIHQLERKEGGVKHTFGVDYRQGRLICRNVFYGHPQPVFTLSRGAGDTDWKVDVVGHGECKARE